MISTRRFRPDTSSNAWATLSGLFNPPSGREANTMASGWNSRLTLWLGSTFALLAAETATFSGGENEETTSEFVVLVTSVLLVYVWLWFEKTNTSPTTSVKAVVMVPTNVMA